MILGPTLWTCCRLLVALLGFTSSCGASKVITAPLNSTSSFRLASKVLHLDQQTAGLQSRCACTKRTELASAHVPGQATMVAGKPFCVQKPGEIEADAMFYRQTPECFGVRNKVSDCLPYNNARTLYLIGDCHAFINTQPGLRSAVSLPFYFYGSNLPMIEETDVFQATIDRLRVVLKPNDLVIFSEILTSDDSKSQSTEKQLDSFKSRLTMTVALCAEKHAQMVIMGDTPALHTPAPLCRLPGKNCSSTEASVLSKQKAKRDILASVQQSSPSIKWFDYLPFLCSNGVCDQFIPGTNIEAFHDDDHLNKKGAQYLWPFMCEWLDSQKLL
jgi:hypothetical protein